MTGAAVATAPAAATEAAARERLGIPRDAQRVLLIGESTHWDPDWLFTSEGYWRLRVRRTLDRALDELAADERRVFGVECIFFLRMYWERVPQRRDEIRSLVAEGRLRLSGSGVTTPDTVLPRTEAVLRDFLVGQEWLRSVGLDQEPRVAYLPDSFGHSPALPQMLAAVGCDMAAITRIDGMFFPGADWELPNRFPRPGSSAERLVTERAADFVWAGADGSEVLCHWNTYGYGMGELLAHRGITRVSGLPLAVRARGDAHVARRIRRYVKQLEAVSRTPYLFCPAGYDFETQVRDLCGLLDRFNENHFAETGIWAVSASLEDHLGLVAFHRDRLPRVELDPNPYWTGFYSSRPSLKQSAAGLVGDLLVAETLAAAAGDVAAGDALAGAWYTACVSNHHDFVTGTSPDRVVRFEQQPWLDRARAETSAELARLAVGVSAGESPPRAAPAVDTGCGITTWSDTGGLWRMGHEFAGGNLRQVATAHVGSGPAAGEGDAEVGVGGARVRASVVPLASAASSGWRARLVSEVPARHMTTVDVACGHAVDRIVMDVPGGVVERPLRRWFDPTYWPLHRWAVLVGGRDRTLVLARYPTALTVAGDGTARVVCGRNATHERAWGRLPIPGMPASGSEPAPQLCEIAVLAGGEAESATRTWHALWPAAEADPGGRALVDAAAAAVDVDDDRVEVLAVKRASRGDGYVVRLMAPFAVGSSVQLRCGFGRIVSARECDVRERDGKPLPVDDGVALVTMRRSIASVRLDVER